jgi:tetratricopeptide (TPR) repeat protein
MTQETLNEKLNLYEAMFERDPRDGVVSVAKTYLYILSGRLQDALKSALEASLSVPSKNLRVQVAIAMCYLLRNKPGEALVESRYALNIDPANSLCHLIHAGVLHSLHRADEARLAFLKALALPSDNTFVADLKLRNREALGSATIRNPLLVAYSSLRLRTPDVSDTEAQDLVAQYPSDPVIKTLRASLYRRSGKVREALGVLETGLVSYESFPERLYLLWKIYDEQLGNQQKGLAYAKRLLEVDPLSDRASAFAYLSLDEEALRHLSFVRTLENLPDSIFARVVPVVELEGLMRVPTVDSPGGTSALEEIDIVSRRDRMFLIPNAGSAASYPPVLAVTPEPIALPPEEPSPPPVLSPQPVTPEPTDAGSAFDETPRGDSTGEPLPGGSIQQRMEHLLEQARRIADSLVSTRLVNGNAAVSKASSAELNASTAPCVNMSSPSPEASPVPIASPVTRDLAFETAAAPTLRDADRLLAEGKFEEALKAFLSLAGSH